MAAYYQGEPIGFKINIKNDDGSYVASLAGYSIEALIKDEFGATVKGWSTAGGTITVGTETYTPSGGTEATRGYASFTLLPAVTKLMVGPYSFEVARVISNGRAIGVCNGMFTVTQANIREGV